MTAPRLVFDQDHTETPPFTPSAAVDYPLPDQRQRGLSSDRFCLDLKSQAEIDAETRAQVRKELDAAYVTPVFWGCIALVVAALAAGWWLT